MTKIRKTPQLKNVYDYAERAKVLEGAFRADSAVIRGQSILLFDDLYRSGATMNAVAKVLSAEGQAAASPCARPHAHAEAVDDESLHRRVPAGVAA